MGLRFTLDGAAVEARAGDTVAAALLRARITTFTRSIKYHRPRGPFCLAGSCGQCLMRIDGVPSVPSCRVPVEEGMACVRQNAPLGLIDADLFRATDFLFPAGLDHHHLMIRSRLLGRVALEVARRLAGLGELPDRVRAPPVSDAGPGGRAGPDAGSLRRVQIAIVGAGPAGLSAARAAAEAGAQVLLLERDLRPGGAALLGIDPAGAGADEIAQQARALLAAKGELLVDAECVGLYPNDSEVPGAALLAVRQGERLLVVVADQVIIACGGASQPVPFAGVDRPGVHAARGLLDLQARCRVRVGESLVLLGAGKELVDCARALRGAGYALARIIASSPERPPAPELVIEEGTPLRALGSPVRAVEIQFTGPAGGERERVRCDAVALAFAPAPLHDLASSAGARARWVPELGGFPLELDAAGRTTVPWIHAAGRAAGLGGAGAVPSGELAGRSAASALAAAAAAEGAPLGGPR